MSGDVGSGKSTLAAYLAGLIPAVSGSVRRTGITSSMVSFQFPEYHITGATLAGECESWGLDPGKILREVGMEAKADTDPLKLSRGELKRLHLACVLQKPYDLLVLDEPFSSLDCGEKQRICAALTRQCHGITIIFTHEQSIFPATDRIWDLRCGRLHDIGPLPGALSRWPAAPPLIQRLVAEGKHLKNISPEDLLEAACRT